MPSALEELRLSIEPEDIPAPGDGATRPRWLKPEKRPPSTDDIIKYANDNRTMHSKRLAQIETMNQVLGVENPAIYLRDRRGQRTGEVETFPMTSIRDEHDRMCSFHAQMDLRWEAFYVSLIDREAAMAKESFLNLLWSDWQRLHSAQGYGPLRWAIPDTISRMGMVAVWIAPDPTNECTGIDIRMLDPSQIFPVYDGKRGLKCAYRIYQASPEEVIANYDDGKKGFKAKIDKIVSEDPGELRHDFMGEVIEYWSREWAVICYQGTEIRRWKHNYYKVPMVIKYGSFGMQGFTSTPRFVVGNDIDGVTRLNEVTSADDRRIDIARQAQPFLYRRIGPVHREEQFGSRLNTMFRKSMNRPLVWKAGPMTARFGNPVVDTRESGFIKIGHEDSLDPLEMEPDAAIIQGLQTLFQMNRDTGMARGMAAGVSPAAQTSGTAMEILAQQGFDQWMAVTMIETELLTEVGERALEIWMEHGNSLGPKKTRGHLAVPSARPDPVTKTGKAFELTPKMVQDTGTRIEAILEKMNPTNLATTANAVVMLHERGLVDDRTAIEILRITSDPDRLIDTVKAKKIEMIPIIEQMDIMDMLKQQADVAIERQDIKAAGKVLFRLEMLSDAMQMEWAVQEVKKLQAEMALMTGAMPPMGSEEEEGPPSDPPETGGGSLASPQPLNEGGGGHMGNEAAMENVQTPGQSMTGMGGQVGTQGGRPPQG
jgi:hypothetical protein